MSFDVGNVVKSLIETLSDTYGMSRKRVCFDNGPESLI